MEDIRMKPKTGKIFRWIITWILCGGVGVMVGCIIAEKAWNEIPTAIFCCGGLVLLMMFNSFMDEDEDEWE